MFLCTIKTDLNDLNGRYVAKPRMKEEQVATVWGEAVIRLTKYRVGIYSLPFHRGGAL
jgi:hypothetical protein